VKLEAKQAVETSEMVHVHVRDEHMGDARDLARGERRQIAYVKQQRAVSKAEVQEKAWIGERLIHQPWLHKIGHVDYPASSGRTVRSARTNSGYVA
jgi:hypothetical protein